MDLIIRNGNVVSSKNILKADVCIKDGKIHSISQNAPKAEKEIDASGLLVMPGGVDVHTHLDMPFMGTFSTDDFKTGTIAAAFGGNTSIIDYIIPQKNQSLINALNIWHKKAQDKAVLDYGFHMVIVPPIENIISEFPKLIEQGITSIKCFLAYKNSLMLDDGSLFKLMQAVKESGLLLCVHAENGEIIDILTSQLLSKGNIEPIFHAHSRPAILEGESAGKVLKFAKLLDMPVYFVHLSTQDALEEIKIARKSGQIVYAETCPQYLLLNQDNYAEPDFNGAKYVMSPPLREKHHTKFLLEAIENDINTIATDHCPFNFSKEKQAGRHDFSKIPNGIPSIETRLPIMFNEMVNKKNLPLTKFVDLNCTQPAKIFGIKNKGDIKEGYDADISIWNPNTEWTITASNLHHNVDYTPFEGYKAKGKPEIILLRGKIIIENNQLQVISGFGKFIKREKHEQHF